MIAVGELQLIARARLDDARVLFSAARLEGAAYLCGYGVELALKARICKTLGWPEFPSTRSEFQAYASFKTHNLEVLLHLSGREHELKTQLLGEWSAVTKWDPESRYTPVGSADQAEIKLMLESAEALVSFLCPI